MPDSKTLSHTTWGCKYHVVFTPKYRRLALYKEPRGYLGEVFQALAAQRECRREEGHLRPDHVPMLISIPPKYAAELNADLGLDGPIEELSSFGEDAAGELYIVSLAGFIFKVISA